MNHQPAAEAPSGQEETMSAKEALQALEKKQLKESLPEFRVGDTIKVHFKVKEGDRERIQVFQGICIRRTGGGINEAITVRKVSFGVGVERIFPLHSPKVAEIERTREGHVRRSRLYYLRERTGKKAQVKAKKYTG